MRILSKKIVHIVHSTFTYVYCIKETVSWDVWPPINFSHYPMKLKKYIFFSKNHFREDMWIFKLKMSLPLQMVHCVSDFGGEPFTAEVTSKVAHTQGKSLPRWTIRSRSDAYFFLVKILQWTITPRKTSVVNHSQRKSLLRWTINRGSHFRSDHSQGKSLPRWTIRRGSDSSP